jgi:dTDP-4-dehydrorhamnose reductase
MMRVAILGSTGMLGSTLTRFMETQSIQVTEFNRLGKSINGKNTAIKINVLDDYELNKVFKGIEFDFVINSIGMVKQVIDDRSDKDIFEAKRINSEFLENLNIFSGNTGVPVIQIGTDCVYSGKTGQYSENSYFDPIDTYGITKTVGEQSLSEAMLIRCSIIGREIKSFVSLIEWVLKQPIGAKINGFTNHFWNGVTTLQFSEIVSGVLKNDGFSKGTVHLVPSNVISKNKLIKLIAAEFGRTDLEICDFVAENAVNRSLVTVDPARNLQMWRAGGYNEVPSIQEMISKYAQWTRDID